MLVTVQAARPGSLHLVSAVDRVDEFQRRHPVVGLPARAWSTSTSTTRAPTWPRSLTYYAFIAIFPLMLLGTSILGFVLRGQPAVAGGDPRLRARRSSRSSATSSAVPRGCSGSVAGVVVGALAALYGALGLGQALQNTQHVAWSVPRNSRPNPFYARVKTPAAAAHRRASRCSAVTVLSTIASTTDVFFDDQWRAQVRCSRW